MKVCKKCGHVLKKSGKTDKAASNPPVAATTTNSTSAYRFVIRSGGIEKARKLVDDAKENDLLLFLIAQGSISAAKEAIEQVAKEVGTVPF